MHYLKSWVKIIVNVSSSSFVLDYCSRMWAQLGGLKNHHFLSLLFWLELQWVLVNLVSLLRLAIWITFVVLFRTLLSISFLSHLLSCFFPFDWYSCFTPLYLVFHLLIKDIFSKKILLLLFFIHHLSSYILFPLFYC